jgi:hypothetical protein
MFLIMQTAKIGKFDLFAQKTGNYFMCMYFMALLVEAS